MNRENNKGGEWEKFSYETLLKFTDTAFNRLWSQYVDSLPDIDKGRILEIAKLERILREIETISGK